LNRTRVREVVHVERPDDVRRAVSKARRLGQSLCIAGGRHAMGGQQFGIDALLLDMRGLHGVRGLDREKGTVEVLAGTEWPEVMTSLVDAQAGSPDAWGVAQKQTGADRLTVGGALAANIHGRGLTMRPFVADVESFTLVDAYGRDRRCSRHENADLFRLAVGGYGLFGVVTSVTLRLSPRRKLRRLVSIATTEGLVQRFEDRIADGFLYGDFQFAVDARSKDFLRRGVFSCYGPVDPAVAAPAGGKELDAGTWRDLLRLAHTDPSRAFEAYAAHYLATSGQVYWSDTHQLATYLDDYHGWLDGILGGPPGSEMITELYVPRSALESFLIDARRLLRTTGVPLVYGTIRLIERDDESFLAWAREAYACVVLNLHVEHQPLAVEAAAGAFRGLIDLALARGGSYYLTYHRYARRDQLLAAYPQFPEFLRLKRAYDPAELFQSEWYRHHRRMLA
jgi:FAD/FMN-containing dehydrogenase